ncbi:MAG: DUF362 domain-containing protein [Acidobacteria bacterium]|nr:DUF362 domain-containing protein [Acidobacteriota bacterium]
MSNRPFTTPWTRREVLEDLLVPAAAGIALAGLAGCGGSGELSADKRVGAPAHDLVVVRNGEPEALVREAVAALGGMKRFVARGDRVVLKPNIGFNRVPEQAANTNPDVVRALAVEVLNAGAKTVKIFDHSLYEARHCYARSGISRAVHDLGVELEFVDERKFVEMTLGGEWLKKWPIYRDVLEADKVINVPVAKQHSTARLSLGFKNLMGVIGGRREAFHQNIHTALADLGGFVRPTLTILDAYRILVRNGPQGGSLADAVLSRTLVAGVDMVAVDAFGCSLFDIEPAQMGFIVEASRRGIGRMDLVGLKTRTVEL